MFDLMNAHTFDIETSVGVYSTVEVGITNIGLGNNESLSQDQYLNGDGFGDTDVLSAQLILTFTAHRDYADVAQNYIFGKLLTLGSSRRTTFKWTEPNGGIFSGSCTIANITPPSGDAGSKGECSFEIHFNGKPSYVAGPGDVVVPTVTTNPTDGSTGFAVTGNFVWTFSEPIQSNLVTDANFFVVKSSDGTAVAGSLALTGGGTIVTFDPTASLTATTAYIATVSKNVKDIAGNSLAANVVTNFTTV